MKIRLVKELYPKEAIIKAAYKFTDDYYVYLDSDENCFYIDIEPQNAESSKTSSSEFINEVLVQTARYTVMQQTRNIRELIVGRALASTIIDNSDTGFTDDEEIKAEDILCNWFDKYDNQ